MTFDNMSVSVRTVYNLFVEQNFLWIRAWSSDQTIWPGSAFRGTPFYAAPTFHIPSPREATEPSSHQQHVLIGGTDLRPHRVHPELLAPVLPITFNSAPYNIEFSDPQVREHMAIGLFVGQFSAVDPDGDPLTYALVDDANGAVALEGDFLVVKNNTKIDYEQSPTLSITVSVTDGINAAVEKTFVITIVDLLTEHVTGTPGNDLIAAGSGNDLLRGGDGDDTLDAGGGRNVLYGGIGDDVIYVRGIDMVVENAGEGTDTVLAFTSYSLGANLENLFLVGLGALDGTGNELANLISGNGDRNHLIGGDGNDTLNGGGGDDTIDGGAGADTMSGGEGNDTYYVDNNGDLVIEYSDEGIDTVYASVSYRLTDNLENLALLGSAINGFGNNLDNHLYGNSLRNLLNGQIGADTMEGGSGDDTYTVDNVGDVVVENAGEGNDWVHASIDFTLGANVENLVLTGNAIAGTGNDLSNTILGNGSNNLLNGGDGDDALTGGAGADTLIGGLGDDFYSVDDIGDHVIEAIGEGNDVVYSYIDYSLTANVEILYLVGGATIGIGNDLDNVIYGSSNNNYLSGGFGSDTINGYGGIDTLVGGLGDDFYTIYNTDSIVTEDADEGIDTVYTYANYTLGANIEVLTLLGPDAFDGVGNELDNIIDGNDRDNVLDGSAGDDTLDGGLGDDTLIGGLGLDVMVGGAGDDCYYIDSVVDGSGRTSTDIVIENFNEGLDTIYASISCVLWDNVENLVLQGGGSVDGYGNGLDNVLRGNAGNNSIYGLGGADTMIGGLGNDTYWVDADDTVIEDANEGVDTAYASTSYRLSDNVENLVLLEGGAEDGDGNALDNSITGNSARNRLVGYDGNDTLVGGASIDTMFGGLGDDTYDVDDSADLVHEAAEEGIDTVISSASFILPDNVENLVLKAGAAITGTGNSLANSILGNELANRLYGNDGNDTISGGGGDDYVYGDNFTIGSGNDSLDGGAGDDVLVGGNGDDTVVGGTGADVFVLNNGATGCDTILDFETGEDHIGLYGFSSAAAPIYSASTGQLYVDPDGNGTAAPVLVAILVTKPALSSGDFWLLQ